jgi:type II secretory pathway pseudopilin PulG
VTGSEERGATVIDLVVSVALILVAAAIALPSLGDALEREQAVMGAHHLAGLLQRARFEALRRGTSVALRFELTGGASSIELFADGNANGVLQRDIDRGVDRAIAAPDRLADHQRGVDLRINQAVPDIGGGGLLAAGTDPLRIGRSALLTFSPTGTATAGTVYVAAERGPQLAVRVLGATGRVRVLEFEPRSGQWRP